MFSANMFISLLQRQVIQLLPWYSRATRQQIENYPNQEIIQILATLVRTEEEYLQHRKEQRERLAINDEYRQKQHQQFN
jgi:hypothetical protein